VNRSQRRAAAKAAKKNGNKELSEKIFLFNQLPDECLTCKKPFDKQDKQMVMDWNVVIREKEKIVRLYCPECWGKAKKFIEELESK
tara:strand:+ start:215 stop:472 length:258 start_codon:yes stop_codon:yes gene_type:complete